MAYDKFFHGSDYLMGDQTTPGLKVPEELKILLPTIFQAVKDFGCDYYPTVIQMLTYSDISEVAAYGGFPVRFPHWKWGMEYEELQRGYQYGMHRIYEMVTNVIPCYIYCLDSNTLLDNVTVVAHALGHNDFFKNNVFFSKSIDRNTSQNWDDSYQNMMNVLANHGTRIRQYMSRWGKERVSEFLDHVLKIDNLIDPFSAWDRREKKELVFQDQRVHVEPKRLGVRDDHEYMDSFINPSGWVKKQRERANKKEVALELGIFNKPTKDIMGYIRDHGNLKPWQVDIISMLREESLYFAPQRQTHMLNEGWASFIDYKIISEKGLATLGQKNEAGEAIDDGGIFEYAIHKAGVLGGKYSNNPYKLGFTLFCDIEDRWNKGKFGDEYDNCTDMKEKEKWDKKLGLGMEKVFEVRKSYDDFTAINEFFTPEFCEKYEFFNYERLPNGETIIKDRNFKTIKENMMKRYTNGGLPEIRLTDPNYHNQGIMLLQHVGEGVLYESYAKAVLKSLTTLWGKPVYLASKDADKKEIVFCAADEDHVVIVSRDELEGKVKKAPESDD